MFVGWGVSKSNFGHRIADHHNSGFAFSVSVLFGFVYIRYCQGNLLLFEMADKPKHSAPHGMEPYDLAREGDLGALSEEQQAKLNKFKVMVLHKTEIGQILANHEQISRFCIQLAS